MNKENLIWFKKQCLIKMDESYWITKEAAKIAEAY